MTSASSSPEFLKSRQHFYLLDGLRGVAALFVVIVHFLEWVYTAKENIVSHGFLAVDFFFCLSGFVIAYAYDARLPQMGVVEFIKSRLIRLQPLVIVGTILGVTALLFDPFANDFEGYSTGKILLVVVCSLFLIPMPVMEERYLSLFGLNAPSWSLFWEYVANITYALVLVRLSKKILAVLTVIAALGILYTAHRSGNLMGGWAGENWADGGTRLAFSFLAGMLIYRNNWIIPNKLGALPLVILISAIFMMPQWPVNWAFESAVVLLVFPLIISLGAGAELSRPMQKVCRLSGALSYPLYMTHYAGIWIFAHYWRTAERSTSELVWNVTLGTLSMIAFAWLVMRFVDTPLRAHLTRKRREKRGTGVTSRHSSFQ